jgi:hypothetical protein
VIVGVEQVHVNPQRAIGKVRDQVDEIIDNLGSASEFLAEACGGTHGDNISTQQDAEEAEPRRQINAAQAGFLTWNPDKDNWDEDDYRSVVRQCVSSRDLAPPSS